MSGWLTNGVPLYPLATGDAQISIDTQLAEGAQPQTAAISLLQLATLIAALSNSSSETTVAGSRYFSSVSLGSPQQLTGISALVGSTGGTDKWLAELYDSNGNLVATSATAGATVGAAGSIQQFAFTAPYEAEAGTYFVAIQSNGTTAKIAAYNGPASLVGGLLTGSATGTFGTGANITPPTTYSAGVGPVASLY